jgi:PAS domain S-box-containing protein
MADALTPDERRFRALASSSVERIAEIDAQGRTVYVSPNHAPSGDHLLATIDAVFDEDKHAVAMAFVQAFESGRPASIAFRVHNLAGEMRWVESTLTPFPTESGERHVLVVSRDVTQSRELERRLIESRERFELIAENAYDMISEYDGQFRLLYRNDQVRTVLGFYDDAMPVGASLVHPDDRERVTAMFAGVLQGHEISGYSTYRIQRADGTWCWIDGSLRGLPQRDGDRHYVIIARDVTARVEAEQRVRESEQRFRELVEHAPLGIFVVQGSEVVFANAAAAAIYGAEGPEELCRRSLFALLDENAVEAVASCMARARGDSRANFAFEFTRPSGERRHLTAVGTVISFAGAPAFQCIVRDVTELEQSRRDQEHLSLQLQEARKLESLGVLAGGIAHDFNNLLAVILSSVRYARASDATPQERSEALGDAEEATESAARLVKQLLAYARRRSPEVRTVELSGLARSLSDLLSTALPNGVRLEIDTAREPIAVHADVVQLEQVLMNLVLNAADAVGAGPGTVTVRTRRESLDADQLARGLGGDELPAGWYACLEVEDTGVGMDAETRAHIFEPFFSTKQNGHGLGLSAVLGLVQGHRGAIHVDSQPGCGTRMRVYLPTDLPSELVATPLRPRALVLVVDSDARQRSATAELLRGAGHDVVEAHGAAHALALCAEHAEELDAAAVDSALRAEDGRSLVRSLQESHPELPLLELPVDALRERVARLLAKRDVRG